MSAMMSGLMATPSTTGNRAEKEQFIAVFERPGPMVGQASQVRSGDRDQATCRERVVAGQVLGYRLEGIVQRGPVGKAQPFGQRLGNVVAVA
jgi:hypothetical protein